MIGRVLIPTMKLTGKLCTRRFFLPWLCLLCTLNIIKVVAKCVSTRQILELTMYVHVDQLCNSNVHYKDSALFINSDGFSILCQLECSSCDESGVDESPRPVTGSRNGERGVRRRQMNWKTIWHCSILFNTFIEEMYTSLLSTYSCQK